MESVLEIDILLALFICITLNFTVHYTSLPYNITLYSWSCSTSWWWGGLCVLKTRRAIAAVV